MHLEAVCPYCKHPAYTDEGPYDDDTTEERECGGCEREYTITSSVSIDWETKCLPKDHEYEIEKYKDTLIAQCKNCDKSAFAKYPTINDQFVTAAFAAHMQSH